MTWTVRYNFRISHPLEISNSEFSTIICGQKCKISTSDNSPIINSTWLIFKFDDFKSEIAATQFGKKFASALILTGVLKNIGIDGGEDKSTVNFSQKFIDAIAKTGGILRPNVHGLSVYENTGEDVYLKPSFDGIVSQNSDAFFSNLSDSFFSIGEIGELEKLALRILALSKIGTGPLAQSILAISAVEAISRCPPWTVAQLKLIEKIKLEALGSKELPPEEASEVAAALDRTFRYGVLQSIRQKMKALGLSRSDWKNFNEAYNLRSSILHGSASESENYNELWNKSHPICDKIIIAAIKKY